MPTIPAPAKVLVTGASGFIAAWVIKYLLEKGYDVLGTVRSAGKGKYLQNLFKGTGSGTFTFAVVEDIEAEGAFDEVVKGVDAVAHMASPVHFKADDPNEIIGPAVNGTVGILASIKKNASTVKRVVITSSVGSIIHEKQRPTSGYLLFDETDWNVDSPKIVEELGSSASGVHKYRASKTLAERAAWDWWETHKDEVEFDLVTICPPLAWGPLLQDVSKPEHLNASVAEVYQKLQPGSTLAQEQLSGPGGNFVDVRDVAMVHALAFGTVAAGGQRFITGAGPFAWQDILDAAHRSGFRTNAPVGTPGAGVNAPHFVYVAKKAEKTFGIKFRGLDETISAMLASFAERGF